MLVNSRNGGSVQTLSCYVQKRICHAGCFALLANLLLIWRRFLPISFSVGNEIYLLFTIHHMLIIAYPITIIASSQKKQREAKALPRIFHLVHACLWLSVTINLLISMSEHPFALLKYIFVFSHASLYVILFFNIQYVFFLAMSVVKRKSCNSAASWALKLMPPFLVVAVFLYSCADVCSATAETRDAICMKPCIDSSCMDTEQLSLFSKLYKFRMAHANFFFFLEQTIEKYTKESSFFEREDAKGQPHMDDLMSSEITSEMEDIITQYETISCPTDKYLVMSAECFEELVMGVAHYLCLRFIEAVCEDDVLDAQIQFRRLSSWEEIAMLSEPYRGRGSDFILSAKITKLRLRILNIALATTNGDFHLALEQFAKVELEALHTQYNARLALAKEKLARYYLMHCCRQDFKEEIARNLFIGYDQTKHIANANQSDWTSIMGVDVLDPWPKHWDEWMVQQGELVVSGSWLSAWSDSQVCSLISRELKNGEISSQKSSFYPMFYYKYLIFNENISQLNQIHQTLLTLCEFDILNASVLPYPERW